VVGEFGNGRVACRRGLGNCLGQNNKQLNRCLYDKPVPPENQAMKGPANGSRWNAGWPKLTIAHMIFQTSPRPTDFSRIEVAQPGF
jgi:hypothetical protein